MFLEASKSVYWWIFQFHNRFLLPQIYQTTIWLELFALVGTLLNTYNTYWQGFVAPRLSYFYMTNLPEKKNCICQNKRKPGLFCHSNPQNAGAVPKDGSCFWPLPYCNIWGWEYQTRITWWHVYNHFTNTLCPMEFRVLFPFNAWITAEWIYILPE